MKKRTKLGEFILDSIIAEEVDTVGKLMDIEDEQQKIHMNEWVKGLICGMTTTIVGITLGKGLSRLVK